MSWALNQTQVYHFRGLCPKGDLKDFIGVFKDGLALGCPPEREGNAGQALPAEGAMMTLQGSWFNKEASALSSLPPSSGHDDQGFRLTKTSEMGS